MAIKDPPPHLKELISNVRETAGLLDIHSEVSGKGPGRKHGVEVLNKSAIVLAVACFEAFVEDLANLSLQFMIAEAKDHTVFPNTVLERVASKNSGINAWKKALEDNLKEILTKTTGALNTPRAKQVDELFLKTIGLENISKTWRWSGRTSSQAVAALDNLVTIRGGIAHRVKHSETVRKQDVMIALDLIGRLSVRSNNEVSDYVYSKVGKYPWGKMTYMKTK